MGKKIEWTVYCHVHRETGRRYVGLTKLTMMKRWNRHVYDALKRKRGKSHFANAIRRYGKDAFDHEILEMCASLEDANAAEVYWINHFDSMDPEKGFNLAKGGNYVPNPERKNPWDDPDYLWNDPDYRRKHGEKMKEVVNRPAVRARIRRAAADFVRSPEWREKARKLQTGRTLSPETRAKISEAHTGRKLNPEHVANYVKTRRAIDDELSSQRDHSMCKVHGRVPLAECQSYMYKGRLRHRCKACQIRRLKERRISRES